MEDHKHDRRLTTHADTDFDPLEYMKKNYTDFDPNDNANVQMKMRGFIVKSLYEIFITGKITGDKLLDIGCGPLCYAPLPASWVVKEIVLCDKSERNIEFIEKWRGGETNYQQDILKYMANLDSSRMTWRQLDRMLAVKVTAVVKGDVRNPNPLTGTAFESSKFDIVIAVLCINGASQTTEEYRTCIRNLCNIMKRGGTLVIVDTLGKPWYHVGNLTFQVADLADVSIQGMLEANGFEILDWKEAPFEEEGTEFVCFVVVAKKI